MHYFLESEDLLVQVNSIGMELSSIKSKTTGIEYLWQGDPTIWSGQAPILFPIIGALKDGKYTYQNQEYHLPKHGFIRDSELATLVKNDPSELIFSVKSDKQTLTSYPFEFVLDTIFKLQGKTLTVSHQVKNIGNQPMYYSIGGHPAFACPLFENEQLEDYTIEFPQIEKDHTWMIQPGGLIGEPGEMVLNETNKIQLHAHLFDGDALIFKNLKSKEVYLNHHLRGSVLKVEFEDFDYLGIWAKPGAPYVCFEPWLGIGDSIHYQGNLEDKEGIRKIESGAEEIKSYTIQILA